MLIVYKYQKSGATFSSLSEAMADFDSKLTTEEKSAIDSAESASVGTGGLSQLASYELVNSNKIIQVLSATRLPTKSESDLLIMLSTKRQEAGWALESMESDGAPITVSNGRFYTNNILIPFYPE